jgi:4-hydroxy-3-methylbut-2-enyl diphosphate reductase
MELWLAQPRGFCAGVDRAVKMVDELLALSSQPVYVRHEIVHNRSVVGRLRERGAVFVDEIDDIPEGALVVVSAHGAAPQVFEAARTRRLRLFDATCPLVSKVHLEVIAHSRSGRRVFLIGHRGHVEVIGTLGHYTNAAGAGIEVVQDEEEASRAFAPDPDDVAYVTQTTLAVDAVRSVVSALRERYPKLRGPHHDDVCYATQNRQDAVRMLARRCGLIIVIGAPHSSNSLRMVEVAVECGARGRLIEDARDIDPAWLDGVERIGLSASASAPEPLVASAIGHLRALRPGLTVQSVGLPETMVFKLPTGLVELRAANAAHELTSTEVPGVRPTATATTRPTRRRGRRLASAPASAT